MNQRQYKAIVKEIAETQAVGPGVVEDILDQYFALTEKLTDPIVRSLTGRDRSAIL